MPICGPARSSPSMKSKGGSRRRGNRWGHRDATMVLLPSRHGLRASELVDLRWDQVDFERATLHVRRVKQGTGSMHPIGGRVARVRRLQREQEPGSPFVFTSERGAPFTPAGFSRMVERSGVEAKSASWFIGMLQARLWFRTRQ